MEECSITQSAASSVTSRCGGAGFSTLDTNSEATTTTTTATKRDIVVEICFFSRSVGC